MCVYIFVYICVRTYTHNPSLFSGQATDSVCSQVLTSLDAQCTERLVI